MTSFNLPQTVTIWRPEAPDAFGGHAYTLLGTVPARWALVENEMLNAQGDKVRTTHAVYTETEIGVDYYVFLGESLEATPPEGAKRVIQAKENPSYLALKVALI